VTRKEIKKADLLAAQKCKDRDNWQCVVCGRGKPEYQVHYHHVIGRNNYSVRWDLDNLITVCFVHHKEFETNPKRFEWWKETYPDRYKKVWSSDDKKDKHTFEEVERELNGTQR